MKILALILFLVLLLASPAIAKTPNAGAGNNIVLQFVTADIAARPVTYSNAKNFRRYFSNDLRKIFDETVKKEQISIKSTPDGEKPCIPDAELFFSSAEGVSTVKVIDNTGNGGEENVNIRLTYLLPNGQDDYALNDWTARIVLKKEKDRWAIDDIYDSKNEKSFKQGLVDNLKGGCYAVH